jgi:hypothetical protein
MHGVHTCPDGETLQRFLLGQCSTDQAETLEAHLEQCGECVATLTTLQGRDSIVDAIQSQSSLDPAGSDSVRHLVERVKDLHRPANDGTTSDQVTLPPPGTLDADRAEEAHCTATEVSYDFLAPATDAAYLGGLGHYRVKKVLGSGGMGVVFEAHDPQLDRPVALKAMLPGLAASAAARQRFLREARAAAAIKHDHIVTIYQVGEDRGAPYLAMELLEGESLDHCLKREPRLALRDVLQIGIETAQALSAAHQRGLIHRDIKPGNIWLEARNSGGVGFRVKLLDFGLARSASDSAQLTQSGAIVGTPAFMAPEQVSGKAVDARSDLFSLGCVLYTIATGEQPFRGTDAISTLVAVANDHPRPPQQLNQGLPPALCDLLLCLLAKQPDERPESAQRVVETLTAITHGQAPAVGLPAPRIAPAALPRRRRHYLVAAALLLGLLGVAGYLLGPIVIRFVCNEGELVISIDDPQIQAIIDQASLVIRDRARNREYRIAPATQPLATGDYALELNEVGFDVRLFAKDFAIVRGGRTVVHVSFDPKLLGARTAAFTGRDPTNLYADPAHGLVDVVDFRDIAGASAGELHDWHAALPPDFRMAHLSSRRGNGSQLFNAVAVRDKTPQLVRYCPAVAWADSDRNFKALANSSFRLVSSAFPPPDDSDPWLAAELWLKDDLRFFVSGGSLPALMTLIDKKKAEGMQPVHLEWGIDRHDGPFYNVSLATISNLPWDIFYNLSADGLVKTIKSFRAKGWRPDVVAPHYAGGELRFMLVLVENRENVDWRFRMDMTREQYEKESAAQRAHGLFPLALRSYGDNSHVRYAAIWIRFRRPDAAAPEAETPNATVLADRAAKAVTGTFGERAKRASFADPAHALSDVTDFREIVDVSRNDLKAWVDGLGAGFQVSYVGSRRGAGTTRFNAVAVQARNAPPVRFVPEAPAGVVGQAKWDELDAEGFRPLILCPAFEGDHKGPQVDVMLWAKDGNRFYNWYGDRDLIAEQVAASRANNFRPISLDAYVRGDDAVYSSVHAPNHGRKCEAWFGLDPQDLLATVEFYRRTRWRPDVLAPSWEEGRQRFMLVAVSNADQVEWRLRVNMSLTEYRNESAEQKRCGLFPLTIASYGDDANARYAAIWVRFRGPDRE